MREYLQNFNKNANEEEDKQIRKPITNSPFSNFLSEAEIPHLNALLIQISPSFTADKAEREKIYKVMTKAWTNEPLIIHAQKLWKNLTKKAKLSPQEFHIQLEMLIAYSISEKLNLAVLVSQRLYAISQLQTLVEKGNWESAFAHLIEKFLWLLGVEYERLTANQSIRKICFNSEDQKSFGDNNKPRTEFPSQEKLRKNTNFVFLSDPKADSQIVVFGLKVAKKEEELLLTEYRQLCNYLDLIQEAKPRIQITGVLVGHRKGSFKETDNRIQVTTWQDILCKARKDYLEYLESLLSFSDAINPEDKRIELIRNFGDDEAKNLIDKILSYGKERVIDQKK